MEFRTSGTTTSLVTVAGVVGRSHDGGPVDGVGPQTQRTLERINDILEPHGLAQSHILRIRVYLTDVKDWPEVLAVLGGWFDGNLPAATVVGNVTLVEPWMKVEIESDASAA
ncbi:MAG: Rid family hydrolase [Actinomycetota bacterium]|nr:Rid family hydrolase [Actinomycetota bacterium]